MRGRFGKIAGAAAFTAAILASGAVAAPTCTTTATLGADGAGLFLRSQIVSGFCVASGDTIYGNFDLGNLPTFTSLLFNANELGGLTRYQLSFGAAYLTGHNYHWGYEVSVSPSAPDNTVIVALDSDFTQTAGGISILDKATTPTTATPIHMEKNGPNLSPTSITSTSFGLGITDLIIAETLKDRGTISTITNTVIVFSPPQNPDVPEPASLAILGFGLAGAGFFTRKRRS